MPIFVAGVAGLAVRWPPAARSLAALAALAGYVLLAVAPGRSVLDGPRRLLTTALPADPRGAELAAVVVAAGLAALWSAHLVLRPDRPTGPPRRAARVRAGSPLAPAAPAVLLFVLALAVGASAGPPAGWIPPALAGLGGLLLLTGRLAQGARPRGAATGPRLGGGTDRPPRRGWTRVLAPLAVLAAVVAVVSPVGPSAPGADLRAEPFDARSLVEQPVPPREDTTPLALFPALRSGDYKLDLDVRTSARGGLWLRMTTLPVFDGRSWTTSATYRRAGTRLAPAPGRGTATTAEITMRPAGALGWLPSPGRPVAVAAAPAELGVDGDTGDLVVSRDGPAPETYEVTGETPVLDPARLRADRPLSASAGEQDGELLGPAVRTAAIQAAGTAATPFARVAAVHRYLTRTDFTLATDDSAPGGHGTFQVSELLRTRSGTAEQYASALALMLRSLGYQARVVMGFRADEYDTGLGGYRLDGSTVDARTEVHFAGAGWVLFDATPRTRTADGKTAPAPPRPADDAGRIAEEESSRPQVAPTVPPAPRAAPAPRPADSGPPRALLAVMATAVLLLVLLLLVPVVKLLRRWRRRRGPDPARRITGAWSDTIDRLVEVGVPAGADRTTGELAADAAAHADGSRIGVLARLRDAAFAPDPPTHTQADVAWSAADDVRRRLRRGRSPGRRARAHLDPRPLLRR